MTCERSSILSVGSSKMRLLFNLFLSIFVVTCASTVSAKEFDTKVAYRLTNSFLGEKRSLDTYSNNKNDPFMGETGGYSGQYWNLTSLGGGYYRLTNSFLGADRSLEMVGITLRMGKTSDTKTQAWKLVADEGYYRLVNKADQGKSLDTYSDGENEPFMDKSANASGQYWLLKPQGAVAPSAKKASRRGSRPRRNKPT